MSNLVQDYAFEDVVCQIANQEVGGWGEEGGIEFEFPEDMLEDSVGATGEVYLSKNSDRRVYMDVTVMQGTESASRLGALAQAQNAARGQIPKVPVFVKSHTTGEIIADGRAVFVSQPEPNMESEISEREFRLLLIEAKGRIVY